jgi:glutathione-regulated potassium-efflux system ancillary protein KefC
LCSIYSRLSAAISALFGLNHGIIDQAQYSFLVATVIGSAVIPTMIANVFFMPRHLLRRREQEPITVGISEQPSSTD